MFFPETDLPSMLRALTPVFQGSCRNIIFPPIILRLSLQYQRILLPQGPTIPIDQERHRNEGNAKESQHAVTPAYAEAAVHAGAGQRQKRCHNRPQHGKAGHGTGRVLAKIINNIGLGRLPDAENGESIREQTQDGDNPLRFS